MACNCKENPHVLTPKGALLAATDLIVGLEERVDLLEQRVAMLCSEPWSPCQEKTPEIVEEVPPEAELPPEVEAGVPGYDLINDAHPSVEWTPDGGGVTYPLELEARRAVTRLEYVVRFKVDESAVEIQRDSAYRLVELQRAQPTPGIPFYLFLERNRVYLSAGSGRIEVPFSVLPGLEYEVVVTIDGARGRVWLQVIRLESATMSYYAAPFPRGALIPAGDTRLYDLTFGTALLPELRITNFKLSIAGEE